MVVPSALSWSGVFRPGNSNFDCQQEDHEEDHGRGDGRLLASRPGDLGDLLPDLLIELNGCDLRHLAFA